MRRLVEHMSVEEINGLKRGGHDLRKLHAAFAAAKACKSRPTVILAKTKKGYGIGAAGESRMTAHQAKKLDVAALLAFRDRFHLPLSDQDVEQLRFYRPRGQRRNALPARPAPGPGRSAAGAQGAAPQIPVPALALSGGLPSRPKARKCPPPWPPCAC